MITAAAAIIVAVFSDVALSDEVFLELMGIGMATAILVDATLVRMALVPADADHGPANWWMPRWLGRVLPAPDPPPAAAPAYRP